MRIFSSLESRRVILYLVCLLLIFFIDFGVQLQDIGEILSNATILCLSCIGIG